MSVKQRKIVVLGYHSVGKSSLCIQFIEGKFNHNYDPTIANTFNKVLRVNTQDYDIVVEDSAGQDEFTAILPEYFLDVHAFMFVYSIADRRSFRIVEILYKKLIDIVGNKYFPSILVGNKADLDRNREISRDEGRQFAERWGTRWFETSAKENGRVCNIFRAVILEIERADDGKQQCKRCVVC